MQKPILYRQGDLIIRKVSAVPKTAKKVNHLTVEEGEVTGHFHKLSGGVLLKTPSVDYARVKEPVTLDHDEHDSITLDPGTYKISRQREYRPVRNERVLD